MKTRKLASYVHVHDDGGKTHVFGPDDKVPDWAAAKITNTRAWADGEAPVVEDPRARVERLRRELEAAEADAEAAAKVDDGEHEESGPYSDLKADELRAELATRELPTSGNKGELIDRLVADDAARQTQYTQ
jgi:hypothetical protein